MHTTFKKGIKGMEDASLGTVLDIQIQGPELGSRILTWKQNETGYVNIMLVSVVIVHDLRLSNNQ